VYLIIAGLRLLYFVCVIVQSIQDKAFGFTVCRCSPRMVASWWWWNIDCWRACPCSASINYLQKRKIVHKFFAKAAMFNQPYSTPCSVVLIISPNLSCLSSLLDLLTFLLEQQKLEWMSSSKRIACIHHYQNKAMCTHNSTDTLQDLLALLLDGRSWVPPSKNPTCAHHDQNKAMCKKCTVHQVYYTYHILLQSSTQPFCRTGDGHGIKQRNDLLLKR